MSVNVVSIPSSFYSYSRFTGILTEIGWRAKVSPSEHPASEYVFDVCISADGKRNTLQGIRLYYGVDVLLIFQ